MKKPIDRLLPVLFMGLFVYSGCAKQGIIKSDVPLAPVATKPAESVPGNKAVAAVNPVLQPTVSKKTNSPSAVSNKLVASLQPSAAPVVADLQDKLEKIFFDFDSSTLSDTARKTLTRNYGLLKQSPKIRIRIEGNCDEHGSDEYNLALGERRAQAAARYLTALGVSDKRVSTISYGKEKPADSGHDENAWAKNRRDEFVITSR